MGVPWQPARNGRPGRGMLLMRGGPDAVAAWAHRGLVPVHVAPLKGWTLVLPAGDSRALPPYDDALQALAGRPVATRLRSAIGFFVIDGCAIVTVHPSGWRAIPRWFVWSPRRGIEQPRELAPGRPSDLARAAGAHDRGVVRGVRDILADGRGDAQEVLGGLLDQLSLPGTDLLDGSADAAGLPGSRLVEPDQRHVARFDAIVTGDARQRAELEEQ